MMYNNKDITNREILVVVFFLYFLYLVFGG